MPTQDIAALPVDTLLADDSESLIRFIGENWPSTRERPWLKIVTSAHEALYFLERQSFGRVVADWRFDQERERSGVDILRAARRHSSSCELYLMTGQIPTPDLRAQLKEVAAELILKKRLDPPSMGQLLSGARQIDVSALRESVTSEEKVDVAELRMRNSVLEELNDLLIEDILLEIDDMPDQDRQRLAFGRRVLSPSELRQEVQKRSEIGREIVRLHHHLFRRLRRRG